MKQRTVKIAPSILSADFSKMGEEVMDLEKNGADLVHVDVMDGVFVKNISFGMKMVKDIRKVTSLPLDVHLMIVEPWRYVESFASSGADIITVHYEACGERLGETLRLIRGFGKKCGLVINPDTPTAPIEHLIGECDMVLVMSVFPGQGGQKFIDEVLPKAKRIKEIIDKNGFDTDLEIDGGVNLENAREIKECGVNVLVAGSTVFAARDRRATIEGLRSV